MDETAHAHTTRKSEVNDTSSEQGKKNKNTMMVKHACKNNL